MNKRIALIGLDGSGKSSNIDKMKLDLSYEDYKFVWVRWKPILLKPAYWLMERKVSKKNEYADKKRIIDGKSNEKQHELNANYNTKAGMKKKIFKNPVIRNVWMLLALIDYFLQFYAKVLPLVLAGKKIIFDRFFIDLFVDQGINFGYTPEKIRSEIRKYKCIFPRIDKYIYIRVNPEICYKRKNDIPNIDYLNRRFEIYECLSEDDSWIIVDGECSFEDVNDQLKKMILE